METIKIHTVNKKQIKAFKEMAEALSVNYHISDEVANEEFLKRLEKASEIEQSR